MQKYRITIGIEYNKKVDWFHLIQESENKETAIAVNYTLLTQLRKKLKAHKISLPTYPVKVAATDLQETTILFEDVFIPSMGENVITLGAMYPNTEEWFYVNAEKGVFQLPAPNFSNGGTYGLKMLPGFAEIGKFSCLYKGFQYKNDQAFYDLFKSILSDPFNSMYYSMPYVAAEALRIKTGCKWEAIQVPEFKGDISDLDFKKVDYKKP